MRALLAHASNAGELLGQLEHVQVRDMDDGAMGSLQFGCEERRSLGSCLVEATYLDRDGVPVSIALNADTDGRLYELDMWKVDFAPLQAYPAYERVTIKT